MVVNVSSPNTPGLRGLQQKDSLRALVRHCQAARDAVMAERWGLSAADAFGEAQEDHSRSSGKFPAEATDTKRIPLFVKVGISVGVH